MSKQEKLISAVELEKYLDTQIKKNVGDEYDRGELNAFTLVLHHLKTGTFDLIDRVPTVKPGDKVRHLARDFGVGVVMGVYGEETVNVQFSDLYKSCKASILEVVKDE